jgi:hypothetical protein
MEKGSFYSKMAYLTKLKKHMYLYLSKRNHLC